jgi:hypothetical protein
MLMSSTTRSGFRALTAESAASPSPASLRLHPRPGQREAEHLANMRIIVDDQILWLIAYIFTAHSPLSKAEAAQGTARAARLRRF